MFKVCEEVFDLEIKSESNQTAWHEDVELWSLWEKNGEQLAYFYLDLYPSCLLYTSPSPRDEL